MLLIRLHGYGSRRGTGKSSVCMYLPISGPSTTSCEGQLHDLVIGPARIDINGVRVSADSTWRVHKGSGSPKWTPIFPTSTSCPPLPPEPLVGAPCKHM